jgi:hypothetical protein
MQDIYEKQKNILQNFKKYFKNLYSLDSFNYCSFISNSLGSEFFKRNSKRKYYINFLKEYFKELISLGFIKEITLVSKSVKNYENIILSWGFKKDYKKNFYDKYFNINSSKYKKTHWIVIYMSKKLPKKIPENNTIVQIERNRIFNIISFFKNIFFLLNYLNFNIKSIFLFCSSQVLISVKLEKIISKNINFSNTKKIFIPYESQLFQKKFISQARVKNNKIKIFGFDHTAPQPIPVNLYHDSFSPDFLIVTSKNKINFNNKFLNWPIKKQKLMKSFRFKINKKEFKSVIFLPYIIESEEIYLTKLRKLMSYLNIKDFKKFKIKNHPAKENSKKHNNLIFKIKNLYNNNFELFSKNKIKNTTIFLGQTTAIPLALETGLSCFNIVLDEVFGVYNPSIWKGLKLFSVEKNIFKYSLAKKNSLIKIGSTYNKLKI